jgi:hypothetical protein
MPRRDPGKTQSIGTVFSNPDQSVAAFLAATNFNCVTFRKLHYTRISDPGTFFASLPERAYACCADCSARIARAVNRRRGMARRIRMPQFAASTIPGAKLVRFERGGHLLMSVEQATIRTVMQKHILDHVSE